MKLSLSFIRTSSWGLGEEEGREGRGERETGKAIG